MNNEEWLLSHTVYYTMCSVCKIEKECHKNKINYKNMVKCIENKLNNAEYGDTMNTIGTLNMLKWAFQRQMDKLIEDKIKYSVKSNDFSTELSRLQMLSSIEGAVIILTGASTMIDGFISEEELEE